MSEYQPIACALHSEYESLAMARTTVQARWRDNNGHTRETIGRVVDVRTRNGEEFMVLAREHGQAMEIRLDRIETVAPQGT